MYSFSSPLAKPPAGSSLLFGALADSGRIKERKNGSYRMVLKGVDEIDWFTDRPYRSEGLWKPQKLIRQWDSFFETSDPNAQASFKVGNERELITFEMSKPKLNKENAQISFTINPSIINKREEDLVSGLRSKQLNEITLFIDNAAAKSPFYDGDRTPSGSPIFQGTEANDVIIGSKSNDLMIGGKGNDKIRAGRGDDRIFGGVGNDSLYGGSGNDALNGGMGNDILFGGAGLDKFFINEGYSFIMDFNASEGDFIALGKQLAGVEWKEKNGSVIVSSQLGATTIVNTTIDAICFSAKDAGDSPCTAEQLKLA